MTDSKTDDGRVQRSALFGRVTEHRRVGVERRKERGRNAMTNETGVIADVPERDAAPEVRQDLGLGRGELQGVGGVVYRGVAVREERVARGVGDETPGEACGFAPLVTDCSEVREAVGYEDDCSAERSRELHRRAQPPTDPRIGEHLPGLVEHEKVLASRRRERRGEP